MKYRKKPIVIEAVQFKLNEIPFPEGVCCCPLESSCFGRFDNPHIHTLEGRLYCSSGDWIITGVKGERYACKPDIFEMTYEATEG